MIRYPSLYSHTHTGYFPAAHPQARRAASSLGEETVFPEDAGHRFQKPVDVFAHVLIIELDYGVRDQLTGTMESRLAAAVNLRQAYPFLTQYGARHANVTEISASPDCHHRRMLYQHQTVWGCVPDTLLDQ